MLRLPVRMKLPLPLPTLPLRKTILHLVKLLTAPLPPLLHGILSRANASPSSDALQLYSRLDTSPSHSSLVDLFMVPLAHRQNHLPQHRSRHFHFPIYFSSQTPLPLAPSHPLASHFNFLYVWPSSGRALRLPSINQLND